MKKPKIREIFNGVGDSVLDIKIIKEVSDIQSILSDWRRLLESEPYKLPAIDPEHYLFEIKSLGPEAKPYIICLSKNRKIISMMIARKEKIRLPIRLGYLTFFKTRVRRILVFHGGFIGQKDEATCLMMYYTLKKSLNLGEADIAIFNHPHCDSIIYKAVRSCPSFFNINYSPRTDGHWLMEVPSNMDDFYRKKNPKTRQTMKRKIKKLERDHKTSVKMYSLQANIDLGISDAALISSKSWQSGIDYIFTNDKKTRDYCHLVSLKGWLRIFILSINDRPAAFLWGIIYGSTFFLKTLGFDPEWKNYSPGSVLFLKSIEFLIEKEKVNLIDFGFGDAEYKKHFATKKLDTQSFYLYGKKPYSLFLYLINFITSKIWKFSIIVLRALGSEAKLKKIWKERLSA